jgi:hypothetical protein
MSEPNNEIIFNTLLDQNKALGRIEARLESVDQKLDRHIVDDDKAHVRIAKLEASHNRMRGATAVWSLVVSAIVSAIGWYLGSK